MVSIVIPVYKVEEYLRDCVDSVLNQTYSDIQVILVDDGSPDGCGRICDEYAEKDSRILVIHKENGGVSSARNLGLEYVDGEYLTFCDSDDMYAPDWIETLVKAIQESQADACIGNFVRYFGNTSFGKSTSHETGLSDVSDWDHRVYYIFNKLLTPIHGWEVCTRLFKTEVIHRENIRFCENCGNFAEDLGFSLTYTLFARRIVAVEQAGYWYRTRSGSMMNTSGFDPKLDSLQAVCDFCEVVIRQIMDQERADLLCMNMQFFLLGNQFSSCLWASNLHPDEFRKTVILGVKDWPVMLADLQDLLTHSHKLGRFIPRSRRLEIMAHIKFLLGKPWLYLRLSCKAVRMFRRMLDCSQ